LFIILSPPFEGGETSLVLINIKIYKTVTEILKCNTSGGEMGTKGGEFMHHKKTGS
jgi:hypothetical protein